MTRPSLRRRASRLGARARRADCRKLGRNRRKDVSDEERARMINIEDPLELSRNLSDVLASGASEKLRLAILERAAIKA